MTVSCKSNFDCTTNAECTDGQCFCKKGFDAKGPVCADVDECLARPCGPYSACSNTPGGFHCQCQNGYVGAPPRIQCKGKKKNCLNAVFIFNENTRSFYYRTFVFSSSLRRREMRRTRVLQTERPRRLLRVRRGMDLRSERSVVGMRR